MVPKLPTEEYYVYRVLKQVPDLGPGEFGQLELELVGCLAGAWLLIFACLAKGVQSTGKVVYFTATFPYVVLFILLIRGAMLDGAVDGVLFYITPSFSKLQDAAVWSEAASQVFYSLGPAFGGLMTMASYNKFHNNCYRDALIVGISDSMTSVFAGFAVFSILGNLAKVTGRTVEEYAQSQGPGLAFVAYPAAISTMPWAPFWSVLFFFMLITLGMDSEFAMVETFTTAFMDQFPVLRKQKTLVVLATCALLFLLGLPMCTNGGLSIFKLIDQFAGVYSVLVLSILECLVIVYVYGLNRFLRDAETMLGFRPGWFWRFNWALGAPVYLVVLFTYACIDADLHELSPTMQAVGWLMVAASLICVPAMAIYEVLRRLIKMRRSYQPGKPEADSTFSLIWKQLISPTEDWCPAHERTNRFSQNTLSMQAIEVVSQLPVHSVTAGSGSVVVP